MRSAGCIVNDIADKNFDKKVERTKNRPIASGKVSVKLASVYALFLCAIAFLVLINFNNFTILMALISMPLAFTYPLMKRITYWPQLFLGITFNYGLILAWISISNEISIIPIIFYLGAIFWTLGYDTIYGFQDIKDDEIIGVKSTSIRFKDDPKKFLFISYFIFIFSLFLVGKLMNFKVYYFLFMIIPIFHLLVFQVKKLNINLSEDCLTKFKSNNFLGLIICINILIGKLL
jgi:4-hydroxybenzoate polyprenyl transferase